MAQNLATFSSWKPQKLVVFKKNEFDTESHFDNSGGKNLNQNKLSFKTLILAKSTIWAPSLDKCGLFKGKIKVYYL